MWGSAASKKDINTANVATALEAADHQGSRFLAFVSQGQPQAGAPSHVRACAWPAPALVPVLVLFLFLPLSASETSQHLPRLQQLRLDAFSAFYQAISAAIRSYFHLRSAMSFERGDSRYRQPAEAVPDRAWTPIVCLPADSWNSLANFPMTPLSPRLPISAN
ncbi:hypothetical protein TgHK011_002794 [Trichoderma gracile]|nr:hypothetical protein TgHK011_002794 [Trichoderma gracile]